jgi:hypothetical protein
MRDQPLDKVGSSHTQCTRQCAVVFLVVYGSPVVCGRVRAAGCGRVRQ